MYKNLKKKEYVQLKFNFDSFITESIDLNFNKNNQAKIIDMKSYCDYHKKDFSMIILSNTKPL
jgi:hypothetical protein